MYKYGVNLLLWTSRFTEKHLNLIKKVKNLKCDVVEIPIFNPDEFPSQLVKKELEKHDLEACACYGCDPKADIASLDSKIREKGIARFKKAIDQAHVIGASKIGGVVYKAGGIFTGEAPTSEEWNFSVESMREIANYAQDFDISIGVEQINRYETYFINTARDAVKYCKDVGKSNLFVLLDTHHLILEELNIYEAIVNTGKLVGHFHTSENNRGIPGTGLVNWKEVYEALRDINYDGWLVIESFYVGFGNVWKPLASSPEELVIKGLNYLKKMEKIVSKGN
ncbi:MAG: sugar phosphate isomerase/epimerase [Promethearchaeota archaeon]|nr:MAG: sugar phosphate isomerase/epimerase [Candidatus Lokiarchaeota archaeon]